jgi:hypothetical protein
MPKIGVNDQCSCGSQKKYKKCCMVNNLNKKQLDSEIYFTGQDTSSEKMLEVLDFYKSLFPKYCLIDITNNLNKDNYKTYLTKNYSNKTIMFAEKTQLNEEFFNSKSNSNSNDVDVDIIIMFAGGYKVIDSNNILMYNDDIKAWINYS